MKKTVSLILAAVISLSLLAGCGETPEPETKKSTTGINSFEISFYYGPQDGLVTEKAYWELAKEAGFTSVPVEGRKAEDNKIALGYLRELGLKCSALDDSRIGRALSRSMSDEETEKLIKEVIDDYAEYDDVIQGWFLQDEPDSEARFKKLTKVINAFRKLDPERNTMVNLLPYSRATDYEWALTYLDPDYISYDHYTFFYDGNTKRNFFTLAEAIRKVALDRGKDYMIINLLTKHWDYADLTYSQILWETNLALCYGMKRLSFFTFTLNDGLVAEGWYDACIDPRGNKYPHFDMVKEINAYALPLGKELFNKDSTAVFHLTKDPFSLERYCVAYESYGKLGKVTGDEFLIGFFSDESFMIMNKKWEDGAEGNNALIFDDVASGLEYFDVESASWKAYNNKNESGKYVYNAEAGEGLLFRVK